jgi:hypothetical protein
MTDIPLEAREGLVDGCGVQDADTIERADCGVSEV